MDYFVLAMTVAIILMAVWLLRRESLLLSPLIYFILGSMVSSIWSLALDIDRTVYQTIDIFGIFADFPRRALIYRVPLLIGAFATVVAVARREVINGRTTPWWLRSVNRLAARCRNRWPRYNVGTDALDSREIAGAHSPVRGQGNSAYGARQDIGVRH